MVSKRKVELVTIRDYVYDGSRKYLVDAIVRTINQLDTDCPEVRRALDILVDEAEWLKEWRYAKSEARPVKLGDKVRCDIALGEYSEGRVYKIVKRDLWVVITHAARRYPLGEEMCWVSLKALTHADGTPIKWNAKEQ